MPTLARQLCLNVLPLAIMLVTTMTAGASEPANPKHIEARSSFINSRIRFERDHKGHVAFMGGSITEMNGYRPMVCEDLQRRFPDTKFTFTDAGISSTCSTTGAFRLKSDVLSKGPVDLFFIEFAVNDDQDAGHARRECIRGLEGLIRQCRQHNPQMDIIVTFFVNEGMLALLQKGETPVSIGAHAEVTQHYGVTTIHLAQEVAERISSGRLTWKVYGGVHPAPAGNRICADMIDQMLNNAWSKPLAANAQAVEAPRPVPLDAGNYGGAKFVAVNEATIKNGWTVGVPDWKSLPGGKRPRFTSLEMLSATEPGAECSLKFKGRSLGVFVVAGPDAGTIDVSIDGGPVVAKNLFHNYSAGLHYPRTVMLATDLAPGDHIATLRISDKKHERSSGHAARIMQFGVNE